MEMWLNKSDMTHSRSRYAATFIRDLDGQVLSAFHDNHLDGWEIVLIFDAMTFDNSS